MSVYWLYVGVAVALTLFAGLMSGLTLGLLSVDELDLLVIQKSGTDSEKRCAGKVMELLRNQHVLLVTLLLGNAAAMEALPVVLDGIASPVVAILLSVTAVLVFGEIIPQAVCKSKGLVVGAAAAPVVRLLMLLFAPVAWPIAKLLDFIIGCEHHAPRRAELAAEVQVRRELGHLTTDEETVMCGALELTRKTCSVCLTPLEKVRALGDDAQLNAATVDWMVETGHSRFPAHAAGDPGSFHSIILVKSLLRHLRDGQTVPVSEVKLVPILRVYETTSLYELLDIFQTGRSHMAAVFPTPIIGETSRADGVPRPELQALGFITLEDVLEELIKEEIVDETDQFVHIEEKDSETAEAWRTRCSAALIRKSPLIGRSRSSVLSRGTTTAARSAQLESIEV